MNRYQKRGDKPDPLRDDNQKYIKEIKEMIKDRNAILRQVQITIYVMGCQKSGKSLLIQALLNRIFPNHVQNSKEILEYIKTDFEILDKTKNYNHIYFQDSDFLDNLYTEDDIQFKIVEYQGFIFNDNDHNQKILEDFKNKTQQNNQIPLLMWVINSQNATKEERLRLSLLNNLNFQRLPRYSVQNFQPINSINTVFEQGIKAMIVYAQCDRVQFTLDEINEEQIYHVSASAYLKQRKQFTKNYEKDYLAQHHYQEQKQNYFFKQQLQILKHELIDSIQYQYDLMKYGSNYFRIYSKIAVLDQMIEGYSVKVEEDTKFKIYSIYEQITNNKLLFELKVYELISNQQKMLNEQLEFSYRCLTELIEVNQIITLFYNIIYSDFSEKYSKIEELYKQNIKTIQQEIYTIFGGLFDQFGSFGSFLLLPNYEDHIPIAEQFICQIYEQLDMHSNQDNFLNIIQFIRDLITKGICKQSEVEFIPSFPSMSIGLKQIVNKFSSMASKIIKNNQNQEVIRNLLLKNKILLESLFVRASQKFIVEMNYFQSFYKIFFSELDIQF